MFNKFLLHLVTVINILFIFGFGCHHIHVHHEYDIKKTIETSQNLFDSVKYRSVLTDAMKDKISEILTKQTNNDLKIENKLKNIQIV